MKKPLSFIFIYCLFFCNAIYAKTHVNPDNLSSQNFSLMAKHIFLKYTDLLAQTDWHLNLYRSYLQAAGITDEREIKKEMETLLSYRLSIPSKEYSSQYLLEHGMKQKYVDHMAVEYAKLKENTYIIVLFPPVSTNAQKAFEIIKEFGSIIHHKTLSFNRRGFHNLITMLYEIHHNTGWLIETNQPHKRFEQIQQSFDPKTIQVVLIECESWPKSIDCKRKIRAHYGTNEACHFNDKRFETIYHAQSLFHDQTVQYLNCSTQKRIKPSNALLREFQTYIKNNPDFYDLYSIDAGRVLDAYGIRLSSDIDIVVKSTRPSFPDIGLNNSTRTKYGFNTDELILNPDNYFYHKGMRFVSLDSVYEYKKRKAKEKDLKDLDLITEFREKRGF